MPEQEILIVDDNDPLRRALRHRIEAEGYDISTCADGREAVEAFQSDVEPDLVVLDVMMPRLDGKRLLRLIRSEELPVDSDVPVILLTSRSTEEDIVEAFESGADDYMSKPFKTPELIVRMQRQLAGSPVKR